MIVTKNKGNPSTSLPLARDRKPLERTQDLVYRSMWRDYVDQAVRDDTIYPPKWEKACSVLASLKKTDAYLENRPTTPGHRRAKKALQQLLTKLHPQMAIAVKIPGPGQTAYLGVELGEQSHELELSLHRGSEGVPIQDAGGKGLATSWVQLVRLEGPSLKQGAKKFQVVQTLLDRFRSLDRNDPMLWQRELNEMWARLPQSTGNGVAASYHRIFEPLEGLHSLESVMRHFLDGRHSKWDLSSKDSLPLVFEGSVQQALAILSPSSGVSWEIRGALVAHLKGLPRAFFAGLLDQQVVQLVQEGQGSVLELLAEKGVSLAQRNERGESLLHYAFRLGREEVSASLLSIAKTHPAIFPITTQDLVVQQELLNTLGWIRPTRREPTSFGSVPSGWERV